MDNKLLLVLNPCAGQRRANKFLPEIIRAASDEGFRVETYVTACSGDATNFIRDHVAEFDRVVCIGGDGTLNEAIAGVLAADTHTPIGYIPAGTTNDYANSIGLSSDVMLAAGDAFSINFKSLDLGLFNGRTFTYTASCGAFTKTSYSTPQSLKNTLGHLAYILEGIKDIPSIRKIRFRIETSEQTFDDDFIFCAVTNSTSIGGIMKLDPEMVSLSDGKFEIMLVRKPNDPIELGKIIHGITTLSLPNDMIHFFTTDKISFHCDTPLEWTLDGERAEGGMDVEISNLHKAFCIAVPSKS